MRHGIYDTCQPLFTVITITYNADRYLRHTMSSVLEQQGITLEYLIIDGDSRDETSSIVQEYAGRDPRVFWYSERDGGISAAMNRGIQRANGHIVAFLHADDYYPDPGALARVAARFREDPGAWWLTGGVLTVNEEGQKLQVVPARRFTYRRLLRNNILLHPATFVRRDILASSGLFSTKYSYAMDYDLWLRLAVRKYPLVVQDIFACFRVHAGSRSTKHEIRAIREEWVIRNAYLTNPVGRILHYLYYLIRTGTCIFHVRHRK